MNDPQRVAAAVKAIDGKRFEYRESVENPPHLPKAVVAETEANPEQTDAPF